MAEVPSYFNLAADALQRAIKATGVGEQGALLEEALRFNRLALAEEKAKLAQMIASPPSASDPETRAP